MPHLVRFYIRNVLIGFGLSALFVGALLWLNIGNLWHLISTSDIGWIAVTMLVVFNGVVFAGVQFAIAIMNMAQSDDTPSGGHRAPVATRVPARVKVAAKAPQVMRERR